MCFALLALQQHPQYPFILAANRDELFNRPATALGVWPNHPEIVGGIDQSSQGSWLALNQTTLKFALVTNVRQGIPQTGERSRGLLVSEFVESTELALNDLKQLEKSKGQYAGFNLLAGYLPNEIYYLSNRYSTDWQALKQGFYGLSNASLNAPWPKVQRGLFEFEQLVINSQIAQQTYLVDKLFELLVDRTLAKPEQLPNTGIGIEKELWLSPIFIAPGFMDYGTRCSTIILMDKNKQVFCYERTYYSDNRSSNSGYSFTPV
ncbi:NRDE family protein [uncultured Thiothrix sp.]|uniref:NRDE family protein n=1 Tax=uncultured Thiothrix sp. TaxID=223185 RepID=UPI00261BB901|nr:NRDE family protein [uncultured Thiothrix sp.]